MLLNVWIENAEIEPFALTTSGGLLNLPKIVIEPADMHRASPAVVSIRVEICDGETAGREFLQAAYGGADELKRFDKPTIPVPPIECTPYSVQLKSRRQLPAGQYLMRVEVLAQEPLAFPGAKAGKNLVFTSERFISVPADLETDCAIHCRWVHQELIDPANDAQLEIEVENLPRDAVVTIAPWDPNHVKIPAFMEALARSLSSRGVTLVGESDQVTTFRTEISIQYNHESRGDALRLAPMNVSLRVAVLKPKAKGQLEEVVSTLLDGEQALKVDFSENMFPGYPILDLGTASTFALIYFFQLQTGALPVEQEATIRKSIIGWLTRQDGPFGLSEWKTVLAGAVRNLGDEARATDDPVSNIRNYLRMNPARPKESDVAVHRLLRALELSSMSPSLSNEFQLGWRRELANMYHRAFRRFPLEQQRLVSVELDDASKVSDENEFLPKPIPSTVQVTGLRPLTLEIGNVAEKARKQTSLSNPAALLTQFHSSPKDYYLLLGHEGATIPISMGDKSTEVSPREFLVATLKRLRTRIEDFRDQNERLPKKRFSKIVMPFPTSAPLSVRQVLLEAAKEAGFDRPIADLDEALSAIVFYLVSPFGADIEMGLEAFRASCRPTPRDGLPPLEWKQNILLIDVGGGTTDIALIEVKLEDAQAKGAGDGSRGKYYRLVPRLLGATGKGQLAGNLISLGVFHEIKKRVVDAVVTALSSSSGSQRARATASAAGASAHESSDQLIRLYQVMEQLPPALSTQDNQYIPGSIIEHYQNYSLWASEGQAYSAFQFVSKVLPTSWKNVEDSPARTQAARAFHLLWEMAEDAKIRVFGDAHAASNVRSAKISVAQIADLFGIAEADAVNLGIPEVTLNQDDFEAAIALPVRNISGLAVELTKDRLPSDENGVQILDRIVLTGQTCRLPRVREMIKQAFQAHAATSKTRFRWDPDCLTFEGEYAKQAAALGAAYAQLLREDRVPPNVDLSLNGNILDIDIQNLFFYLQCGFFVLHPGKANNGDSVLLPLAPFSEFDEEGVGRLQSAWDFPTESILVERYDHSSKDRVPWGHFDCRILATQLGMTLERFQKDVRYALEADHRLIVSVLFCMGDERHYQLPTTGDCLNIPNTLRELNILRPIPVAPAGANPVDDDWLKQLKGWRLGINVKGGFGNENLIEFSDSLFNRTVRHPETGQLSVAFDSVELPPCPENGRDKFYLRSPIHKKIGFKLEKSNDLKPPMDASSIAAWCSMKPGGSVRFSASSRCTLPNTTKN